MFAESSLVVWKLIRDFFAPCSSRLGFRIALANRQFWQWIHMLYEWGRYTAPVLRLVLVGSLTDERTKPYWLNGVHQNFSHQTAKYAAVFFPLHLPPSLLILWLANLVNLMLLSIYSKSHTIKYLLLLISYPSNNKNRIE